MALPATRYNFKGGKKEVAEAVGEIGKAIFQQVNVSVTAAAKSVVPNVADMVSEITEDLKSGSLLQFQDALKKIDKLVNDLGVDINTYSKELGDFLKMRQEKSIKSEETVNQLREKNIISQVNEMGEVQILNKLQIQQQEENLKSYNNEIRTAEKTVESLSRRQQRGRDLTEEQQRDLLAANEKIIETTEKRNQVLQTLNKQETEDTRTFRQKFGDSIDEYIPDGLRDVGSAFTEGLMAPFSAIKELGLLFGGMLKPLKMLPKLFMLLSTGIVSALVALAPFIGIALAVVAAIGAIIFIMNKLGIGFDDVFNALSGFAKFVMDIPNKIARGFKFIFNKIKNFFIDAINGVITLLNKIPGVEFDKLERADDGENSITSDTTNNIEASEGAETPEIIPAAPSVSTEDTGESKLDKFKNFFKFLKPTDSDLIPTMEANASGPTIIDNSVKSANQNNNQQAASLSSRNDDLLVDRLNSASA